MTTSPPTTWADSFRVELQRLLGTGYCLARQGGEGLEEIADKEQGKFLSSLPPGYVEETPPEVAARDWLEILMLQASEQAEQHSSKDDLVEVVREEVVREEGPDDPSSRGGYGHFVVDPWRGAPQKDFRLRRTGLQRLELSTLLPVLESFGLAVVESVPWNFVLAPADPGIYVDDIGLRASTAETAIALELNGSGARLVEAVEAVLAGDAERNALSRLVLSAGLTWREVNLLCAYQAYRRAVGGPRAIDRAALMGEALVLFPSVAAGVIKLFDSLLVPAPPPGPGSDAAVPERDGEARLSVLEALSRVPDLAHHEVLAELLSLVEATTRSNWALKRGPVALKFASTSVPFLPAPKPTSEIFVWAPWFQGLHLRFGPVARGGIRWSERQRDLRTEVLGLARAQVKKNSLIVPTGAKGAFVLHDLYAGQDKARDAYAAFVGGLLELTDNIVDGKVRHPKGICCRDGEDPYLVVAPDKGTATFSDLANEISKKVGFWLGDAFASGGSNGYDHKALGITAKGAWLAVERHFRALGIDPQREPIRVVGVGDMSGDVFGNGMLQSRALCLIAAFDHRDIFVDPSPDPGRSYEERLRLSRLARSSWRDYDLTKASPGSTVYSRQAAEVPLSDEARSVLNLRPGPVSANELVRAILQAPADLIFFGGIGTFVKAPDELDAEVDDASNDDVRVSADHVRARVVVEGANLAVTQRARISYSRRGGRVNADFVDNAGGVALSDREVNLKVLLNLAESHGRLDTAMSSAMLGEVTDEVVQAVLTDVSRSIDSLDHAALTSAPDLPAYESLMEELEARGSLDPAVESLPDAGDLNRRRGAGAGLTRPEVAVVLGYARTDIAVSMAASPEVTGPAFETCALSYFPGPFRDAFSDLVRLHPLYNRIVGCQVANEVVDRMGPVWAHEVARESRCQLSDVTRAYWAAREVLGGAALYDEVDALSRSRPDDVLVDLRAVLSTALDRLVRWYLSGRDQLTTSEMIERYSSVTIESDRLLVPTPSDGALQWSAAPKLAERVASLVARGVPSVVAEQFARLEAKAAVGEVADVARASGKALQVAWEAYQTVSAGLSLPGLSEVLRSRATLDRWDRWQQHALADELARLATAAAIAALAHYPDLPGGDAGREWLAENRAALEPAAALVEQAERTAAVNLSLASLAVRSLADVIGRVT
jgi:glutamate dehydrogenase